MHPSHSHYTRRVWRVSCLLAGAALAGSVLLLAGCLNGDGDDDGHFNGGGPPVNGGGGTAPSGNAQHDTDGVFNRPVRLNSINDFEAAVQSVESAFGNAEELFEDIWGEINLNGNASPFAASASTSHPFPSPSLMDRRSRDSDPLARSASTMSNTRTCPDGGSVTYSVTENVSNTREEWSAEARFSNCRVDFDGSSGVVNGTASGQRVVDISHNGDEDETGNLRIDLQGNFAGQPIVVDVTASWTHLWRDQARTWDETNRIPRAEIVLFSDYVGILDATIHWKEQGHSHGTYTEEENMTLTLGSSVLNGFVNITTPSTIVTHDDGYSDLCPTRGVLQIAGSGTAQIRYGEDMSVPRTNGVDLVVGGQTRTFTHCDDFEDEFYLGL